MLNSETNYETLNLGPKLQNFRTLNLLNIWESIEIFLFVAMSCCWFGCPTVSDDNMHSFRHHLWVSSCSTCTIMRNTKVTSALLISWMLNEVAVAKLIACLRCSPHYYRDGKIYQRNTLYSATIDKNTNNTNFTNH